MSATVKVPDVVFAAATVFLMAALAPVVWQVGQSSPAVLAGAVLVSALVAVAFGRWA